MPVNFCKEKVSPPRSRYIHPHVLFAKQIQTLENKHAYITTERGLT